MTTAFDLPYGPDPAHRLDLYRPATPNPPVVLFLHGGGWAHGDKAPCPAAALTEFGIAVASANYRLTPVAPFPAQIDDARRAAAWLRAHAADHGCDGTRLGAWGISAGGHLACLLGVGGSVDAVCDWFAPTDLTHFPDDARAVGLVPKPQWPLLVHALFAGRPERAADADPVRRVTPACPPFLIQHGDRDDWVPLGQSQRLADALAAAGVPHTFTVVRGGGHGPGFDAPAVRAAVVEFFRRTLPRPIAFVAGIAGFSRPG